MIFKLNPALQRILKLLAILLFQWHLLACCYWYVVTLENYGKGYTFFSVDGQNQWVPPSELWCDRNDNDLMDYCNNLSPPPNCQGNEGKILNKIFTLLYFYLINLFLFLSKGLFCPASIPYQYCWSFFYAIGITVGIGRNVQPSTFWEHVVSIIMIIIGVIMFALIVGSASSLLGNLDSGNAAKRMKLESIQSYLRQRIVPDELQARIIGYYKYMWSCHHSLNQNESIMVRKKKRKREK